MRHVLLIEEGWHSTLDLAAALEHAGFAVTVLTANGTTARCRRRTVQWTSGPRIASAGFLPHVDHMMLGVDHALPLTEPAMCALWDARRPWSDRIHPRAEPWQQRLLRDKHELVDYMAARGIEIPHHTRVGDPLELAAIELPVVVKAATGSGGRMVRIVETAAALGQALARARELGGTWILQQLIAGPTYLFGGLFHDGRPIRIYAAEKLEQHPPRTGGAIHLRSRADAALIDAGLRVMRELRWTGFASADFVRRSDGTYLLLEVNPRLWGSLAGARSAGVDLFAPFAELLAGGAPCAELGFASDVDCLIFPRYLSSTQHRNLAGVRRALRDLRAHPDWLDPAFVVHILRRLYWMRRQSQRM